jgi:predicted SAM-dependent methyltransferase
MAKTAKLAVTPQRITGHDLKLDLACGDRKTEGFLGIDKWKTVSADYVFDLLQFPWPIDDDSVMAINCSHFFEHIPGKLRPDFMDECFRVMKKGGQMIVTVPYGHGSRAYQDYTHEWPPVVETSFLYFNKGWREMNKLTHGAYDIKCDFDFGYGWSLDPDVNVRNQEYQQFAIKNYVNAATDLQVSLTKR